MPAWPLLQTWLFVSVALVADIPLLAAERTDRPASEIATNAPPATPREATRPEATDPAVALMRTIADRVFQIRVIDLQSNSKASLGSAFLVSADGLLATNFHVVAGYVHAPDRFRIEYVAQNGETGALQIRDVDAVNDLALVSGAPAASPLLLAQQNVAQGDALFSIGNPLDLGLSVVPGVHNGLVQRTFLQRMLFSGSINPGMSGGPTLNAQGQVVGINVSTMGEQLSFLIPVARLRELIAQAVTVDHNEPNSLSKRISAQLLRHSEHLFAHLLTQQWPNSKLGAAQVIGEMAPIVHCWGESSEDSDETLLRVVHSQCIYDESIYLSDTLTTNVIEYEFSWMQSLGLAPLPLYRTYSRMFSQMWPASSADQGDVTNFSCKDDIVKVRPAGTAKAVFCARAYTQYPELYDVLFIAATLHDDQRTLISHFALSGVSEHNALAFAQRFADQVSWDGNDEPLE